MLNFKNTSKWNELFLLNSKQVSLSQDLVELEFLYQQFTLSELIYRRRKAVIENELEKVQEQQNNLRNQLYKG